jgi:hypothetical protein
LDQESIEQALLARRILAFDCNLILHYCGKLLPGYLS